MDRQIPLDPKPDICQVHSQVPSLGWVGAVGWSGGHQGRIPAAACEQLRRNRVVLRLQLAIQCNERLASSS